MLTAWKSLSEGLARSSVSRAYPGTLPQNQQPWKRLNPSPVFHFHPRWRAQLMTTPVKKSPSSNQRWVTSSCVCKVCAILQVFASFCISRHMQKNRRPQIPQIANQKSKTENDTRSITPHSNQSANPSRSPREDVNELGKGLPTDWSAE